MKSKFLKLLEKGFDETPKGMIGQTESGKAVLGSNAEEYSRDFTSEDHEDAEKIHKDKAAKYQQKQRSFMMGKQKGFNHRLLAIFANQQAKHKDHSEYHKEQAESVDEDVEKSTKEKFKQKLIGGIADSKKPSDFDSAALREGQKVEREHTTDSDKAKEIAMDHLTEDAEYYKKLKTLEKKQGVPEGANTDTHERCVKDVKAKGHDKSSAYAICNAAGAGMKKGFFDKLLDLEKGGPGSGKKGHKTQRLPYPGEEAHKLKENKQEPEKPKTLDLHELPPEHYSTPNVTKYKKLLKLLGPAAEGRFTYDPKSDKILAISQDATDLVREAMKQHGKQE